MELECLIRLLDWTASALKSHGGASKWRLKRRAASRLLPAAANQHGCPRPSSSLLCPPQHVCMHTSPTLALLLAAASPQPTQPTHTQVEFGRQVLDMCAPLAQAILQEQPQQQPRPPSSPAGGGAATGGGRAAAGGPPAAMARLAARRAQEAAAAAGSPWATGVAVAQLLRRCCEGRLLPTTWLNRVGALEVGCAACARVWSLWVRQASLLLAAYLPVYYVGLCAEQKLPSPPRSPPSAGAQRPAAACGRALPLCPGVPQRR